MGGFCGGGSGSVGAANTPDNDTGGSGNSFSETVANFFTQDDGASYVGGQLVDDKTGQRISSGGTSSAGKVISGSANTESNDMQGPMPAGINFAGSSVRPIGVLPSSNRDNRTFTLDQQSKFTLQHLLFFCDRLIYPRVKSYSLLVVISVKYCHNRLSSGA